MRMNSRARTKWPLIALGALGLLAPMRAAGQAVAPATPQNPPARVTLDDAIDLALKHNHSLQAARTTILENQARKSQPICGPIQWRSSMSSTCRSSRPVHLLQTILTKVLF